MASEQSNKIEANIDFNKGNLNEEIATNNKSLSNQDTLIFKVHFSKTKKKLLYQQINLKILMIFLMTIVIPLLIL